MSDEIENIVEATATYVAYALPQQLPRTEVPTRHAPIPASTVADFHRDRLDDYEIENIVDIAHELWNTVRDYGSSGPRCDASWPKLRERLEWAEAVLKSRDTLRAKFLIKKVAYFLGHASHPSHQTEVK